MAATAVESRTMMTENEVVQQRISDHLGEIRTAMTRMAVAMEASTINDRITHRQVREPPPAYEMSTNIVIEPGRPDLQIPIHDRIDAIERDKRTLQIAFGMAITAIAICYIYSEAKPIPLPVLLSMLLAFAVGCAVSRRS